MAKELKTTVDIVIVNWNSGAYLRSCVESIERLQCYAVAIGRIVIVDNASTDHSADDLPASRAVTILHNETNSGFASASNRGAKGSAADLLLFLNPDVTLHEGSLEHAVEILSSNPRVAVVGIRLFGEDGMTQRTCCRIPTLTHLFLHTVGLDRVLKGTGYSMSDWRHDVTREVDHVIGAFYLIRRSVFELLDGFDERFFVYLEDLDLSRRVKGLGFKSIYTIETEAFHAGGGTTRSIKATRLFYSLRSRLQYVKKHHGRIGQVSITASTLLFEPIVRLAIAIGRGSLEDTRDTIVAYVALIRWLTTRI